jgi:hypothetical protein
VTPVFGKSVFDNHQTVFTASFARILLLRDSECVKKLGVFPPRDFARFRCRIDSFLAVAVLGVWTGRPEPGEVVLSECAVASRRP